MVPCVTSKPQYLCSNSYIHCLNNSLLVVLVSKLPFQTNIICQRLILAKVLVSHLRKIIIPKNMGNDDLTVVLLLWIFFIFFFAISFTLLLLNVCQALLGFTMKKHESCVCEKTYVSRATGIQYGQRRIGESK